jgi:hypothetical protein
MEISKCWVSAWQTLCEEISVGRCGDHLAPEPARRLEHYVPDYSNGNTINARRFKVRETSYGLQIPAYTQVQYHKFRFQCQMVNQHLGHWDRAISLCRTPRSRHLDQAEMVYNLCLAT